MVILIKLRQPNIIPHITHAPTMPPTTARGRAAYHTLHAPRHTLHHNHIPHQRANQRTYHVTSVHSHSTTKLRLCRVCSGRTEQPTKQRNFFGCSIRPWRSNICFLLVQLNSEPRSQKHICSYDKIICRNSYLSPFSLGIPSFSLPQNHLQFQRTLHRIM